MYYTKQWLFLLHHSLEYILPKDSFDCFWGDLIGDDGVDVFGNLHSIRSLASSNLDDDRLLRVNRKLWRTSRGRDQLIGEDVLKYPGYSRSIDTRSGGDSVHRKTIRGKREDIFLVSRGNGMYYRIVEFWKYFSRLNSLTIGSIIHNITMITIHCQLVAIETVEY